MAVPRVFWPSSKTTVPVADDGATVAVKVTLSPYCMEVVLVANDVVEDAETMVSVPGTKATS